MNHSEENADIPVASEGIDNYSFLLFPVLDNDQRQAAIGALLRLFAQRGTTGRALPLSEHFLRSANLRVAFHEISLDLFLRFIQVIRRDRQPMCAPAAFLPAIVGHPDCSGNAGAMRTARSSTSQSRLPSLTTAAFSLAFSLIRCFSCFASLSFSGRRRIAPQSAHFSTCGRYSALHSGHILFCVIVSV
jgi:hypothetical protein